jgi:large subunit ribosomal protein L17
MRHRNSGRRLSMDTSERTAMFRNMVTSLLLHERITTTHARAKELRKFAERVISIGKRSPTLDGLEGDALAKARAARVSAIRRAKYWVHDDAALGKLFGEYKTRYAGRAGGYTRIVKAGKRTGDNAPMAIIELVDRPLVAKQPDVPTAQTESPAAE